ncbi:unnamed protein product [Cochlearia groenlandica]
MFHKFVKLVHVNETKALPGRVPSIKAKPKSKLEATLLWNLNLASATILVGARASSLLGVSFTRHPRCSVFSASGKQNYRAFPAPDNKILGACLLSAILGNNVSWCSASLGFRAYLTKLETVGSKA